MPRTSPKKRNMYRCPKGEKITRNSYSWKRKDKSVGKRLVRPRMCIKTDGTQYNAPFTKFGKEVGGAAATKIQALFRDRVARKSRSPSPTVEKLAEVAAAEIVKEVQKFKREAE